MSWISVKDRLPDTATDCLVVLYFKDGGEKLVDIAHFSDGEFYTSIDGFFTCLLYTSPKTISGGILTASRNWSKSRENAMRR